MRSVLCLIWIFLLVGCSRDGDHPPEQHGSCTYGYNGSWQNSYLVLVHDDDRDCPVGANVDDPVYTAGTVYDLGREWPDTTLNWDGNGYQLWLSAHDGSTGSGSGPWDFSGTFAVRDEYFAWGWPRDPFDDGFEWQATESISWNAGQSPDFVLFQVEWYDLFLAWGEARMTISYWGDQM